MLWYPLVPGYKRNTVMSKQIYIDVTDWGNWSAPRRLRSVKWSPPHCLPNFVFVFVFDIQIWLYHTRNNKIAQEGRWCFGKVFSEKNWEGDHFYPDPLGDPKNNRCQSWLVWDQPQRTDKPNDRFCPRPHGGWHKQLRPPLMMGAVFFALIDRFKIFYPGDGGISGDQSPCALTE